jgi:hypothetical protein
VSSALFQVFLPAVCCLLPSVLFRLSFALFLLPAARCHLPAENLAWFLLVVSDSFALKYEQVKFRE